MALFQDFRAFLLKQNVMNLAVAVVIGGAVGKVVSGVVDDLVMPVIGLALPGGDWRTAQWAISATGVIKYGDLLGRLLDFAIIAFVVFLAMKWLARLERAPAPPTKGCPACLEVIPAEARRCRACGEPQLERGHPLEPAGGS